MPREKGWPTLEEQLRQGTDWRDAVREAHKVIRAAGTPPSLLPSWIPGLNAGGGWTDEDASSQQEIDKFKAWAQKMAEQHKAPPQPAPLPPTLTAAQQRVAQSQARIIVMHGERQSGKSHAAFVALERNERAVTAKVKPSAITFDFGYDSNNTPWAYKHQQCRQVLMAPDLKCADIWMRSYAHYLIHRDWEIVSYATNGRATLGACLPNDGNGCPELLVSVFSAQEGTNIINHQSYHAGLTAVASIDYMMRGVMGSSSLHGLRSCVGRDGLILVEVFHADEEIEFVEFSGKDAM